MNIKLANTFLFVRDIEASKEFYIKFLDQVVQNSLEDYVVFTSGLALWQLPEDSIISLKLKDKLNRLSNNRIELYFETDDVDSCFNHLKEHQIEFIHEMHEESWGQRDFRFLDPDGNLVEIGESMARLPLRLHNSGMNVEQISAKTGMSKDHVMLIINEPEI